MLKEMRKVAVYLEMVCNLIDYGENLIENKKKTPEDLLHSLEFFRKEIYNYCYNIEEWDNFIIEYEDYIAEKYISKEIKNYNKSLVIASGEPWNWIDFYLERHIDEETIKEAKKFLEESYEQVKIGE